MPVLFSVVIPVYNRSDHIGKLLKSFASQDYTNFEILIVDDGSTDNLQFAVSQQADSRVRYFYKENGERGAARNFGASNATGDYITFFDSDDIVYPWFLSNAAVNIAKLGNPECYAQKFEAINDIGVIPGKKMEKHVEFITINEDLLHGNMLACNGVFLRKDIAMVFRFSEDRNLSGSEDWLLWLRVGANFPFYYNETICSCLINHGGRGELNIDPDKFRLRALSLKANLDNDHQIDKYGEAAKKKIITTFYLFAAQKYSQFIKFKAKSAGFFLKALSKTPGAIVKRRTLIYARSFFLVWR